MDPLICEEKEAQGDVTASTRELVVLGPGLWVLSPAPAELLRLIMAGGATDRGYKVTRAPWSLQTGAIPYFLLPGLSRQYFIWASYSKPDGAHT